MSRPKWAAWTAVLLAAFGCAGPAAGAVGRQARNAAPVDDEDVKPALGLLAEYRSLTAGAATARLVRIDAKPAFTWGRSSPHPRLRPGPFEVRWTGVIAWRETGPVRFGAYLGGELTLTIDGDTVLRGRGKSEGAWVEASKTITREPGLYRLRVQYRSITGVPARVQLWWESKQFSREPVPAAILKHLPNELPAEARREAAAAEGQAAVGRLGCARCHHKAFPGVEDPPPGPSLADLGRRVKREWLIGWLADPAKVRRGARMPALFAAGRQGFVERWLVADYLLKSTAGKPVAKTGPGDHRAGKQAFLGLGCVACHTDPERPAAGRADPDRYPLENLGDRTNLDCLADFLRDPAARYPDGRMPRLPIAADMARDVAAYLLLWSKPVAASAPADAPVRPEEIARVVRRLKVANQEAAGPALVREKGCLHCHPGLGKETRTDIPLKAAGKEPRGCLAGKTLPRFNLGEQTRRALAAYLAVAGREKHPSEFEAGQRRLRHLGCWRCHQRDGDRPAPLEEIGRTLWTPWLYRLPFQRTPRLTQATGKFTREYLLSAVRDGVSKVRPDWYSYRMPTFGPQAEDIVRALAAGDGDLPTLPEPRRALAADPTLTALGPTLVGFSGYTCVSCHVWGGKSLAAVEPGSVGPELTTLTRRVRRDWFDRFLEGPLRVYTDTPMPAPFRKGEPAPLQSVFGGDAARQKDALWAYLSQGDKAPPPSPPPPIAVPTPRRGGPPLVAQIPVELPDRTLVESICVLYGNHDLIVYDVEKSALRNVYTGGQILRQANIWRTFALAGSPVAPGLAVEPPIALAGPKGRGRPTSVRFRGYDRLADGVRLRWRLAFESGPVEITETLAIRRQGEKRVLLRELRGAGPAGQTWTTTLPAERIPKAAGPRPVAAGKPDEGVIGPLVRPGYRAILYPRPKTASGEDRVMPSALAVDPRTGRVFVASLKLGELLALRDPHGDGRGARFDNFAHGLFQDVFGMQHDGDALHVLHRRNLTRVRNGADGLADRFDRVAALPHAAGNAYDWAYGLVRDHKGRFLCTLAPHANPGQPGSGSLLRLTPGGEHVKREEIAFGFRNPLGWASGPDGEVFFTDNQGEWVATNKLCHIVEGRFYGFPNPAQAAHAKKPMATTAVWIPYGWAKSINGLAYDSSGGKFGPFAGQFFLAELMYGGAIVRANVERVNGVYQGACFPFWGKGLLGPLMLAFDPKGRLYVGSITTPAWMGQPDRGALFRIAYTGPTPFEIQSIHAQPRGFRLVFTRAVDRKSARALASYRVEHYRYEYTGAYGSPELDRTRLAVRRVVVAEDGRSVDLETAGLVKGRVYAIAAAGVRSAKGEALVHPEGAYTLNEIPGPSRQAGRERSGHHR
jgi:mono/diheme cytochrome c family protein